MFKCSLHRKTIRNLSVSCCGMEEMHKVLQENKQSKSARWVPEDKYIVSNENIYSRNCEGVFVPSQKKK